MTGPDVGATVAFADYARDVEALRKKLADAQATVEALQRERDEARKRVDELEAREVDVVLLRDELDAEREKRTALLAEIDEGLTLSDNLLAIRTVTALYDELAQLQALVRALPAPEEGGFPIVEVDGDYYVNHTSRFSTKAEADAYTGLLTYRATLDATTLYGGEANAANENE